MPIYIAVLYTLMDGGTNTVVMFPSPTFTIFYWLHSAPAYTFDAVLTHKCAAAVSLPEIH